MTTARGGSGRFQGAERINVEGVPAIPASIARALLLDPARTARVAVWLQPDDPRTAEYVAVLSADPMRPDGVVIAALAQPTVHASVVMATRRQGGTLCTWRCPAGCGGRTRALFTFGLRYGKPAMVIGCMTCLSLTYRCQGGAATPRALIRRFIGIEAGERLPSRSLLLPDLVTADLHRDLRKIRNLTFGPEETPQAESSPVANRAEAGGTE